MGWDTRKGVPAPFAFTHHNIFLRQILDIDDIGRFRGLNPHLQPKVIHKQIHSWG